jgi:hypothetical protein
MWTKTDTRVCIILCRPANGGIFYSLKTERTKEQDQSQDDPPGPPQSGVSKDRSIALDPALQPYAEDPGFAGATKDQIRIHIIPLSFFPLPSPLAPFARDTGTLAVPVRIAGPPDPAPALRTVDH